MKKIFLLFLILYPLSLIINSKSYAATELPSPSDQAKVDQQIDELKDRIASRVAELNLVEKKGIIGTVADVTGMQITLTDVNNNTRFVDVDELTKFNGGPKDTESFGISDITKGSTLGVLGLYNKQSRRILARTVDVVVVPKIIHGNVATIDPENFILNIASDKNEQLQVEVENTTKTSSYDDTTKGLVRSGFSKIKEGQTIFTVGFTDKTVANKVDADRIIVFPNIVKGPKELPVTSPSITPSTGSGKKLTPIVK